MEHHKNVNQKLESFMKRNLLSSEYQRIRCYERCVVDKAMKLALLTSKNLIITDSPPRTILYTLPLVDFLSLTLVQDLPEFLHGDERFKSQHISLKFRQDNIMGKVESPLNESTSSYISVSSDGDTSTERSPSSLNLKPKKSFSSSLSTASLSSTSWQGTLTSPRGHKHGVMRLDSSLDERVDRLNLSDSGSSVSSWSQGSSQGSPLSSSLAELDLFLLTDTTLFFLLLKAASLNEKIAGTKRLSFTVNGGIKSKRKKSVLRCQLYAQLSSEIRSYKSLERRFSLVQELHTASCNDSNIKSYFWKDVDLCRALVDDLGRYRCGTGENNRADEIEYLIQLESCLSEMFRESEHLSQRASLLTANSNTLLRMLLENIGRIPGIPAHLTSDTEVEGLCVELLDSTVTLLFEVLLAASEHPTYGTDLAVSRVINLLETNCQTFDPLYSNIIERGMYLISRTNAAHTTHLIHCVFYVVEVLCRNSRVFSRTVRTSHLEDIRYYCSNPELKIVRYSPLQALTIARISRLLETIS